MHPIIYFFPFIAALTGWMLHSLVLHTWIPVTRRMIIDNAGRWMGSDLLSSLKLNERLEDPSLFEKIRPTVEVHVNEFLRVKLARQMPMISMFVGEKTIDKMKSVFMEELQLIFPRVIGQLGDQLSGELNVDQIVRTRLGAIDDRKWKEAIFQKMGPELGKFRKMGALTGFIIGSLLMLLLMIFT